ncbi:MAG: hypothetical protein MK212_07645 [Saprospiraceae bacterium]|nr:hypothetical protein [Saprospiraceae bacterium]
MKSIFKIRPEDFQKPVASFKKYRKFLVSGMRQLAELHNNPKTAIPFCLHLKHQYPGDPKEIQAAGNILFAVNNPSKWKNHLKGVDQKEYITGTCFLAVDSQGQPSKLVLQVLKGKAKTIDIQKKLRPVKKKINNFSIEIVKGLAKNGSESDTQDALSDHGGSSVDLGQVRKSIELIVQKDLAGLKSEIKNLKKLQEFQSLAANFKEQLESNKNPGIKAQFSDFMSQLQQWENQVEKLLTNQQDDQNPAENVSGGLSDLFSRIKDLASKDLKNFSVFQQGQQIAKELIQKALELRKVINVFEHEFAKAPVAAQKKMEKEQAQVLELRKTTLDNLKKLDKNTLKEANAGLNQQKVQELGVDKKTIQTQYKSINLKGGLKAGDIPKAQELVNTIQEFKNKLKETSKRARQPFMGFFKKLKKLNRFLNKSLKDAGQSGDNQGSQQDPVLVKQIVEEQTKVFAEVEALVKELDIFNIKL